APGSRWQAGDHDGPVCCRDVAGDIEGGRAVWRSRALGRFRGSGYFAQSRQGGIRRRRDPLCERSASRSCTRTAADGHVRRDFR
ncbi:hypothetical protein ABTH92_21120, partial [Acinetobacter baumannii]